MPNTIAELRKSVAAALGTDAAEFTVDTLDLLLLAANTVRLQAELANDLEFQRKLVSLTFDARTGGSLADATEYGTEDPVIIKTVVDVVQVNQSGNFFPVEWTTVSESLDRIRSDSPRVNFRYPTDAQAERGTAGQPRVTFIGDRVYIFPKPTTSQNVTIQMHVYSMQADWEEETETDLWLTSGFNYMHWACVVWLNNFDNDSFGKKFISNRQEGGLPPPQALADAALAAFIMQQNAKYETFRRHSR